MAEEKLASIKLKKNSTFETWLDQKDKEFSEDKSINKKSMNRSLTGKAISFKEWTLKKASKIEKDEKAAQAEYEQYR